jgi:hypothetical protein
LQLERFNQEQTAGDGALDIRIIDGQVVSPDGVRKSGRELGAYRAGYEHLLASGEVAAGAFDSFVCLPGNTVLQQPLPFEVLKGQGLAPIEYAFAGFPTDGGEGHGGWSPTWVKHQLKILGFDSEAPTAFESAVISMAFLATPSKMSTLYERGVLSVPVASKAEARSSERFLGAVFGQLGYPPHVYALSMYLYKTKSWTHGKEDTKWEHGIAAFDGELIRPPTFIDDDARGLGRSPLWRHTQFLNPSLDGD